MAFYFTQLYGLYLLLMFLVINNAMYYLKEEIKVTKLSQLKIFTKRLIDIINTSIISI